MVDNIPSILMKDVPTEDAEKLRAKLSEIGAKIELE